jgi:hypothetical protein
MGAPRALRLDTLSGIVVVIARGHDLIGRDPLLDPVRERRDNIVSGITGNRR